MSQNDPTLLEYRRTSLIHTVTLIIDNLSDSTLDDLDTTSQAWASVISVGTQGIEGDQNEDKGWRRRHTCCSRLLSLRLYVPYLPLRVRSPLREDIDIRPLPVSLRSIIRVEDGSKREHLKVE